MQLSHCRANESTFDLNINEPVEKFYVRSTNELISGGNYYIALFINGCLLTFTNKFNKTIYDNIELYELDFFAGKTTLPMNELDTKFCNIEIIGWNASPSLGKYTVSITYDYYTDVYCKIDKEYNVQGIHDAEYNPKDAIQGVHDAEYNPKDAIQGVHDAEYNPKDAIQGVHDAEYSAPNEHKNKKSKEILIVHSDSKLTEKMRKIYESDNCAMIYGTGVDNVFKIGFGMCTVGYIRWGYTLLPFL